MLSYQHGYHAGNAADLHKHSALAALLRLLTVKDRGISYLESHAGRGLYDLAGTEAVKTGEAARGVLAHPPADGPYAEALAAVRARHGAAAYPGSPLIARHLLRPQDRLHLCELHPGEHRALSQALAGPGVAIHRRDGHEGLRALCPPKPRRGLALIDPSYEVKSEFAATADTALEVLRRWPEGVVLVWYPILPAGRHGELIDAIEGAGLAATSRTEVAFADPPERGMQGSGLLCLNPPFGTGEALDRAARLFPAVLRAR